MSGPFWWVNSSKRIAKVRRFELIILGDFVHEILQMVKVHFVKIANHFHCGTMDFTMVHEIVNDFDDVGVDVMRLGSVNDHLAAIWNDF